MIIDGNMHKLVAYQDGATLPLLFENGHGFNF